MLPPILRNRASTWAQAPLKNGSCFFLLTRHGMTVPIERHPRTGCPSRCATAIGERPAAIVWLLIVCRRSCGRRPVISARLQTSAKCRLRTLLRSRRAPFGIVKTKGDPCPSAPAADGKGFRCFG